MCDKLKPISDACLDGGAPPSQSGNPAARRTLEKERERLKIGYRRYLAPPLDAPCEHEHGRDCVSRWCLVVIESDRRGALPTPARLSAVVSVSLGSVEVGWRWGGGSGRWWEGVAREDGRMEASQHVDRADPIRGWVVC